jgi:uncharacterized protein (DUF1501 family)
MAGSMPGLAMTSIDEFVVPGWDQLRSSGQQAVLDLYRGVGGPLGGNVPLAIDALGTASRIRAVPTSSVTYPAGAFAGALQNMARILKAEVGLQVGTLDVGGWDTHTDESRQLDHLLTDAAAALRAFFADLGSVRRQRVTVAVMTEFGRRVTMNGNAGSDHGHGSVMWLLGGGLTGGVHGAWRPLSAATLTNDDVPGLNNPFDVLGELVQKRLGAGSLTSVFPGYAPSPLNVATTY